MLRIVLALAALSLATLSAAENLNTLTADEQKEGWKLLFNGKDLGGWEGDNKIWAVRDGMIVGSTEKKTIEANSFLITKEKFSNFVLKAEIKLRNHNSGIQFRSEAQPGFVVQGYQADAAEGNWWGSIYGEKTGRGVIANGWADKGEHAVKDGWNQYEIYCNGDRIMLTLNGLVTVDLEDDMSSDGVIALQLHRGPPMEVTFRNVKIKTLK